MYNESCLFFSSSLHVICIPGRRRWCHGGNKFITSSWNFSFSWIFSSYSSFVWWKILHVLPFHFIVRFEEFYFHAFEIPGDKTENAKQKRNHFYVMRIMTRTTLFYILKLFWCLLTNCFHFVFCWGLTGKEWGGGELTLTSIK